MEIEEKLSAIKAINNEIDQCDRSIEKLEMLRVSGGVDCLTLVSGNHECQFTPLPNKFSETIIIIMKTEYNIRKKELIEKASELMK